MNTPDQRLRPQGGRLRFARFVLDLNRGCLEQAGETVTLRPKTFAVLEHLVKNSGRLISKEELFAAVWPNLAVTDDVLVQSIGELRRALGQEGQRLIKTVPRRGYRLEAEVAPIIAQTSATPEWADGGPSAADQPTPVSMPLAGAPPLGKRSERFMLILATLALVAGGLWFVDPSDRRFPEVATTDHSSPNDRAAAKPAIAVLPFVRQSDDQSRDHFADGLTQDVINALGRFSALTVMSWNAVLPYKDRAARPQEIGRLLGVAYLLEGRFFQAGDRVRVTAQLVETAQGGVLWSARFDQALTDVFVLQDVMTTQIAGALAVRISKLEERRASTKPTEVLEAYDFVLRARPALQRPTRANLAEARVLLRRAIALDPNYAAAHAALAETFYIAASQGWAESAITFLNRAEELAHKALALDDTEVRARTVLGRIHLVHQRFPQAKVEIDNAIAINPNDPHGIAAHGNILLWVGQTDAAVEFLLQAYRIDPYLNAMDRFALSLGHYLQKRYDLAVRQAQLNVQDQVAAGFSQVVLAAAYAQLGRPEDAHQAAELARRSDPTLDPRAFGNKFLQAKDLEHLRDGLEKAGLGTTKP